MHDCTQKMSITAISYHTQLQKRRRKKWQSPGSTFCDTLTKHSSESLKIAGGENGVIFLHIGEDFPP